MVICKVVTYGRWSLTRSGRYERVDCIFIILIAKIYQTLKKVSDHISKNHNVFQKSSATCRIFNSSLGVWKCGETCSFVFDTLPKLEVRNLKKQF